MKGSYADCPFCALDDQLDINWLFDKQPKAASTAQAVVYCKGCERILEERRPDIKELFAEQQKTSPLYVVTSDFLRHHVVEFEIEADPFASQGFITGFAQMGSEHFALFASTSRTIAGDLAEFERSAAALVSLSPLVVDASTEPLPIQVLLPHVVPTDSSMPAPSTIEGLPSTNCARRDSAVESSSGLESDNCVIPRNDSEPVVVDDYAMMRSGSTQFSCEDKRAASLSKAFSTAPVGVGSLRRGSVYSNRISLTLPAIAGVAAKRGRSMSPPVSSSKKKIRRDSVFSSNSGSKSTPGYAGLSDEVNIRNILIAYITIIRTVRQLGIDISLTDEAMKIFHQCALNTNLKNRNTEAVALAALIGATRRSGEPRTIGEVSHLTKIPQKELGRSLKLLTSLVDQIPHVSPSSIDRHIPRFCEVLHLDKATTDLAMFIGDAFIKNSRSTRRNPVTISVGAIYLACQVEDAKLTQSDVVKVGGLTELTVRKIFKELVSSADLLLPESYVPKISLERLKSKQGAVLVRAIASSEASSLRRGSVAAAFSKNALNAGDNCFPTELDRNPSLLAIEACKGNVCVAGNLIKTVSSADLAAAADLIDAAASELQRQRSINSDGFANSMRKNSGISQNCTGEITTSSDLGIIKNGSENSPSIAGPSSHAASRRGPQAHTMPGMPDHMPHSAIPLSTVMREPMVGGQHIASFNGIVGPQPQDQSMSSLYQQMAFHAQQFQAMQQQLLSMDPSYLSQLYTQLPLQSQKDNPQQNNINKK